MDKKNCYGCGACMNVCPKQAITMNSDKDGYIFPVIDHALCVECGKCEEACAFQNKSIRSNKPIATYVAINKNKTILLSSASGGVFPALASLIFERNGVIFGCAYNNNMEPEHICVDNPVDIKKLQGSKYVQSNINTTYIEAKQYLKDGRWVLFVGTPCQIAGLNSYLGKDYNNLITVDLICEGVPSADFFKGYIKYLEIKLKGKVIDFKFRDKSKGWGHMGKVIYKKNGRVKEKLILPLSSYYYSYFMKGCIYRESCYECRYACSNRNGDFTIGDYWGVEKAHPKIETKNGVSVLLVNSKKGMMLIDELAKYLDLKKSTFEQARLQNGRLNRPTAKSDRRQAVLRTWREGGYQAVADEYYKDNKKNIRMVRVKMLIPLSIKKTLRKMLNRR